MRNDAKNGFMATLAAAAVFASFCAVANDPIGIVKRSEGDVTIERGDTRTPAAAGIELFRGDRVLTDANAYAELKLRGAPPLRVGPNANVAVDRFAATREPTKQETLPSLFQGLASLFTGFSRHR